jgi:hypothetical protein
MPGRGPTQDANKFLYLLYYLHRRRAAARAAGGPQLLRPLRVLFPTHSDGGGMAHARKKAAARHSRKKAARHPAPANDDAPQLSRRPLWQGNLRLSLVSCPIALYSATSRRSDVSFHLLNPRTNNRIRMIPTDPDAGPVERADLVKGYEISKNHYVKVTAEELEAV